MKISIGLILAAALLHAPRSFAVDSRSGVLAIVRGMPWEMIKELRGGAPDGQGMVGHNQPTGYLGAEYQRGGMDTLLAGIVLRKRDWIEEGLGVADSTFVQQSGDGGFGDRAATGAAFWINACARSFLAVKESEFWPEYRPRIEGYYPALRRASQFLIDKIADLEKHDKNTPNRLFIDANALFLTAKLLGEGPPPQAAELRDRGLALFDQESGVFLENGGGDTSYQAVNLQMLMLYATYYPSPAIDDIVKKGLAWELAKVNPDGSIQTRGNSRTGVGKEIYFGRPKDVNYREVSEMFAYAGQLYGDDRCTQAAIRIRRRIRHR